MRHLTCNETTMSSVECLRDLINERLTAAAEEIFRVLHQTIVEYEGEIDRQRRLLDIVWKHRTGLLNVNCFNKIIQNNQLHISP